MLHARGRAHADVDQHHLLALQGRGGHRGSEPDHQPACRHVRGRGAAFPGWNARLLQAPHIQDELKRLNETIAFARRVKSIRKDSFCIIILNNNSCLPMNPLRIFSISQIGWRPAEIAQAAEKKKREEEEEKKKRRRRREEERVRRHVEEEQAEHAQEPARVQRREGEAAGEGEEGKVGEEERETEEEEAHGGRRQAEKQAWHQTQEELCSEGSQNKER